MGCHSNKSSYPIGTKAQFMQILMSLTCLQNINFNPLTVSEKIFEYIFENLPFVLPRQPIKLSDLDKSHMKCKELLNKHVCKWNRIQLSPSDHKLCPGLEVFSTYLAL